MPDRSSEENNADLSASQRIAEVILDYVGQTPASTEQVRRKPARRARAIARHATRHAALTAGSLTLPPGPLGWLTLLPELRSLWKLQTQMVADIAACYGKTAELKRAEMLYCLFRHTDPQAVRDLVAEIGKRYVVQRAARPDTRSVALKIGLHISQRLIGKGISRWIPVVGALGAGAYAYYDTSRVARTAIEFFTGVIDVPA
ncbi:MAG TPA: EcsC family protein [Accumulibacter sp.]|uniref:EcsC family protein n=1 Tax=Accumulibacter sp. TaxID=2053492 RepID=UPI0025D175D1|nr:EcsC family protein [Accumulibacter sp.]MCM8599758.1 EcsC family protein [Accumulibacter sp.]MCM8663871.1 EcsC family protein [Accumulibacter sp.]HNC51353.1 EcsC family protein [Accumulibacter sp.]